jgi:hypothetical protein
MTKLEIKSGLKILKVKLKQKRFASEVVPAVLADFGLIFALASFHKSPFGRSRKEYDQIAKNGIRKR